MKNHRSFVGRPILRAVSILIMLLLISCSRSPSAPSTQIVEVTRIVEVIQVVQATRVIPVTQVIQGRQFIPVTRVIPSTRIVPVTQIIPVTRIVEVAPPAATEAPMVPAFPAPTEAPVVPAPTALNTNRDLLVWYDFEEDFLNSGTVHDRSGHGYDGQIIGSVDVSTGLAGGRSIFLYGDGFILAPANPAAGRNTVSLSLWFKTEHPEDNYKLASAAWWNGGPGSGWIVGTHYPEFWSDNTRSIFLDGRSNEENSFLPGEWNQEVITYDGQRIREYTNGRLINDWPTTGAAIGQGEAMAVGGWPSFGFNLQGNIDEFKVFTRCLTQDEVQTFYNQGK